MNIYFNNGIGFGDLWSALHFLLRKSEASGEPSHISRYVNEHDVGNTLESMLTLIDAPSSAKVIISDEHANISTNGDSWGVAYYPTKVQWSPPPLPGIAYQFDGKSSAHIKNPTQSEVDLLTRWAANRAIPLIKVGLPLTMAHSAMILAKYSSCFIGCCSGMSTLALATRVPTYVLEYELKVAWWYGPNPVNICPGMQSFIEKYEASYG
jgi:hypothetical protein